MILSFAPDVTKHRLCLILPRPASCPANRNMEAGQETVDEAHKVAQGNKVTAMKMDLADLATVKQFVTEFLSKFSRLDVLVNNAGVMACPFETTKDGYEKQFQTNHIGGFAAKTLLSLHRFTSSGNMCIACLPDHARDKL